MAARKPRRTVTKLKSAALLGKAQRRRVAVFCGLLGAVTVTCLLLLMMAPPPPLPDAVGSLFAIDAPASMDAIFDTEKPVDPHRWMYIYVHHSKTATGSAQTLSRPGDGMADHFIVGNGDGCIDGEIQIGQRWTHQSAAAPPLGAQAIDPACVSICLVGDFDQTAPTPTQMRRVAQLVQALQSRCRIPAANIITDNVPASPAGVGAHFPIADFRNLLLGPSASAR